MIPLLRHFFSWLVGAFRSREELMLKNQALRQQLLALHAKRPRPRLSCLDKLFWIALRRAWSGWKRSLVLVTPETVVRWHRTGFRFIGLGFREIAALREETLEPGSARPDFPHGRREPDVGSTSHPRELLKLGFQSERYRAG